MSILVAENLAKSYGAQEIFRDLSLAVAHGDKIALVGANGTGKTTLLRLLAGLDVPDAGRISLARGIKIGYLPQDSGLVSESTLRSAQGRHLYEEMLGVFIPLLDQQAELARLEHAIAESPGRSDLLARYERAREQFEWIGGYTYETRIRHVLIGLGFKPDEFDRPLANLSDGQRTRALLAKLLLQEPNLLLLDEPTNHLDLAAIEWLEKYLAAWPEVLVVVAHDRRFLDKIAIRVWELSFGRLEEYPGNYSRYIELHAARQARQQVEYERQQKVIAKEEDFIRRYKAGQRSKEAHGRQKKLDRLERVERPRQARTMRVAMRAAARGADQVLVTHDLVVGYNDQLGSQRRLFDCPEVLIRRGERVALLGPNGCGKTTFLRTIVGQASPLAGRVVTGANIRVGYFPQAHADLDPRKTILDEILDVKNLPLEKARTFLGRFLFSGDDVFKMIGMLSGGERARVALAKLSLLEANFLLLDEPTHHLDLPSQELLQQVLADFDGTLLFVSHDRYFIDALATQVWVVDNGQLHAYRGNYSAYLEARAGEEVKRETPTRRPAAPRPRRDKKDEQLESEIAALEDRLTALSDALAEASTAQDVERVRQLGAQYQQVQEELEGRLGEWVTRSHNEA